MVCSDGFLWISVNRKILIWEGDLFLLKRERKSFYSADDFRRTVFVLFFFRTLFLGGRETKLFDFSANFCNIGTANFFSL